MCNTAFAPDTRLADVLPSRGSKALAKELKITTVGGLLSHFPRRYLNHGTRSSLDQISEGEEVTFLAEVVSQQHRQMRARRGFVVEVLVTDVLGQRLRLAFFSSWAARKDLLPGSIAAFAGKVSSYRDELTMSNPQFVVLMDPQGQRAQSEDDHYIPDFEHPIPVYPGSSKLASWTVQEAVETVMSHTDFSFFNDAVPQSLAQQHQLGTLEEAYRGIHVPGSPEEIEPAWHRFRVAEALTVQGLMERRRREAAHIPGMPMPLAHGGLLESLDAALPFALTAGQQEAGRAISDSLSQAEPMNRLLQGEVGSGKTLVALRAMLQVIDAGAQAALVAPTEVLVRQHERSLRQALGPLVAETAASEGLQITVLTGSMSVVERRQALLDIVSGQADLVIGTHALFGDHVDFFQLGLAVVDEQHRFGVKQRNLLRRRFIPTPHLLVMTATPIPRSVAMTAFGDLELTTLAGLPQGRKPIDTHVVPMSRGPVWIQRVWERVAQAAAQGRQCYIVCPRIEPEDNQAAVELIYQRLVQLPVLSEVRFAIAHGKLAPEELAAVMEAFHRGEVDALICTTVIEVGVDVPNASLMVVLDADHFGMSTLHQLRGRIGRGTSDGNLCLLVTQQPEDAPSVERLREVAASNDGEELARLDLLRRREGDILSSTQSGTRSSLKLLRAAEHEELIVWAGEQVRALTDADAQWESAPGLQVAVDAMAQAHDGAEQYSQEG